MSLHLTRIQDPTLCSGVVTTDEANGKVGETSKPILSKTGVLGKILVFILILGNYSLPYCVIFHFDIVCHALTSDCFVLKLNLFLDHTTMAE